MVQLMKRHLGVVLLLGGAGYLVSVIAHSWRDITAVLGSIHLGGLLVAFLFVQVGYVLRFTNWQLYLHSLGIRTITRSASCAIFFSAFALSITPGKVGELARSVYLHDLYGVPYRKSTSIFVIDRLTDVIALLIFSIFGLSLLGAYQLHITFLIIAVVVVVLSVLFARRYIPSEPEKTTVVTRFFAMLASARDLLRPWVITRIMLISLAAWGMEVLALTVIVRALGEVLTASSAASSFSLATLAGALSFLPGGVGVTEGSLTYLLQQYGVSAAAALSAALLIRIITLWYSIAVGMLFTVRAQRLIAQDTPLQ
jgi:uncharacterized protein (TIRG00374 family)